MNQTEIADALIQYMSSASDLAYIRDSIRTSIEEDALQQLKAVQAIVLFPCNVFDALMRMLIEDKYSPCSDSYSVFSPVFFPLVRAGTDYTPTVLGVSTDESGDAFTYKMLPNPEDNNYYRISCTRTSRDLDASRVPKLLSLATTRLRTKLKKLDNTSLAFRNAVKKASRISIYKGKLPPVFWLDAPVADVMFALHGKQEIPMGIPRVAVVGGYEKMSRQEWPKSVDVRTFSWDSRAAKRVVSSAQTNKLDRIIFLSKWTNHSDVDTIKNQCSTPVMFWPFSPAKLAEELPRLLGIVPPPQVVPTASPQPHMKIIDFNMATWGEHIKYISTLEPTKEDIFGLLDIDPKDAAAVNSVLWTIEKLHYNNEITYDETTKRYNRVLFRPGDLNDNDILPEPSDYNAAANTIATPVKDLEKEPTVPEITPAPTVPTTTDDAAFLVTYEGMSHAFTNVEDALSYISKAGVSAKLWQRRKLRVKIELDE